MLKTMEQEIEKIKAYILEHRNVIKKCPCCNASIEDRSIMLYSGLIKALYAVCKWCQENNRYEFEMNEIRHLLGRNEYARFGDLVWFGGLVYKQEKAQYGINLERAKAFFRGETTIPLYITINQINKEIVEKQEGYIYDVKKLAEWITDENKLYDPRNNPYKE